MRRKKVVPAVPVIAILMLGALACSLAGAIAPEPAPTNPGPAIPLQTPATNLSEIPESTEQVAATAVVAATHLVMPSNSVPAGKLIYDVVSQDTAPEKRAPYGDSYDINRLERPFLQDMTYVADLDIATFTVSSDDNWWYVSIELVGNDPNNTLGIDYGVELDLDHDGFGDYLIWAHAPYSNAWATTPVQVFQDKNHDTGGRSAEKSDAPITTDGYEALIFNGGTGDADPDLAWFRLNPAEQGSVQFSFKKSWSGTVFMLGVVADTNLKDPKKLDYVDRFPVADAGSPVRNNRYYPLKALFGIDNACREAFGFKATGYEPQLCPREAPPATRRPKTPVPPPPGGCQDPGNCPYGWSGEPWCGCTPF
ncbi:MAG: hypothetical protein V1755_11305 [Chloroflexota bacterium]